MNTLKLNDLGIDVIRLQLCLNLFPTAYFDQRTHRAVMAFQKANKLKTDGVVGAKTRLVLGLSPVAKPVAINPTKPWLAIAVAEKGIVENPSSVLHNPRILEYHKTTLYQATNDETAWCSSFVNFVITQSGRKGTDRADAKSWLKWKDGATVTNPERGDIAVIRNAKKDKENKDEQGFHVGFFISKTEKYIKILGGNQGRPGDGKVNELDFSLEKNIIKGYRRPSVAKTAMYLKFGNIKGNVTAGGYEDQIAIATLNFDVNRNVSMETGNLSNREPSKPTLSQIAITKLVDKSVASLFQQVVRGNAGQDLTISFVRTAAKLQEYMSYKLKDCILTNYSIAGDADETLTEGLMFSYSAIEISYKDHDASNKSGSPQRVAYDVKAAKLA